MKRRFAREIASLCLPVLLFGGAAWWKNWRSDPHIYIDSPEVGAVSLEREIFLTGQQSQRRVHLATVVNWNLSAVRSTPDFEVHGRELASSDEELRASNGKVWRRSNGSLSVDFQPGGQPSGRSSPYGRRLQKLHWMVTIPADAPPQDLKFSATVTAPGLEKKTVTFLARPAWKSHRPLDLTLASITWKHLPKEYAFDGPKQMAVVRLRFSGKKQLFCDRMPIERAPNPATDDYFYTHTFTPSASSRVSTLIWGEAQWAEDPRGKLRVEWRRANGGDMNYNNVECKTPYLDAQGFIVVRYVVDKGQSSPEVPLKLKAQIGIVGEGLLLLSFPIP